MRAMLLLGVTAALFLTGCDGEAESIGTAPYPYDPVCALGPVTVDKVKYEVVGVEEVGDHAPASAELGPSLQPGTLERFDDGTATWTGSGYVVQFDANIEDGNYQVC